MIDSVTILLSLGLVLYTIVRAVLLDRRLPWFDAAPDPEAEPGDPSAGVAPWRRGQPARALRRPSRK